MNSALASLGKNLILLAVVVLTSLNLFYAWLNTTELMVVQLFAGLGYVFLSCYEYLNASYKASLPVQRYPYFTSQFYMFRALKISIFLSFALLLFSSESSVQYMYPICLLIAGTEAIISILKFRHKLCFVNIYANYLLIAANKMDKVFASEIKIIEFRHDIFYFVKKNKKYVQIKLEHIDDRDNFVQALNEWINRNQVTVSPESKLKISELITS